jgi:hypothetical protein
MAAAAAFAWPTLEALYAVSVGRLRRDARTSRQQRDRRDRHAAGPAAQLPPISLPLHRDVRRAGAPGSRSTGPAMRARFS